MGKVVPRVSGSSIARMPPAKADPPIMTYGKDPSMLANRGATIPPSLPNVEAKPTALPLSSVGYNSAV